MCDRRERERDGCVQREEGELTENFQASLSLPSLHLSSTASTTPTASLTL